MSKFALSVILIFSILITNFMFIITQGYKEKQDNKLKNELILNYKSTAPSYFLKDNIKKKETLYNVYYIKEGVIA